MPAGAVPPQHIAVDHLHQIFDAPKAPSRVFNDVNRKALDSRGTSGTSSVSGRSAGGGVALSPDLRYLAVADSLGRVGLYCAGTLRVLHLWKGYRLAQCVWVSADFLAVYATRRGLLEVWNTKKFSRVRAWNLGTQFQCALVATAGPADAANAHLNDVLLIRPTGLTDCIINGIALPPPAMPGEANDFDSAYEDVDSEEGRRALEDDHDSGGGPLSGGDGSPAVGGGPADTLEQAVSGGVPPGASGGYHEDPSSRSSSGGLVVPSGGSGLVDAVPSSSGGPGQQPMIGIVSPTRTMRPSGEQGSAGPPGATGPPGASVPPVKERTII